MKSIHLFIIQVLSATWEAVATPSTTHPSALKLITYYKYPTFVFDALFYLNFCLFLLNSSHSLISGSVRLLSIKRIKRYFPRKRSDEMWTNLSPEEVSETPTEEQAGSTIFMGMLFPILPCCAGGFTFLSKVSAALLISE